MCSVEHYVRFGQLRITATRVISLETTTLRRSRFCPALRGMQDLPTNWSGLAVGCRTSHARSITICGHCGLDIAYWLKLMDQDQVGCIEFVSPAGDDQQQRNLNKLEAGLNSIGNVRFIPGMHDGRPVAMRLSESVVLRDAAQKVSARRLHDQGGRIANRLYTRRLADRAEAPELYCAE